jgi:predicted nucleic acid-binding protein
MESADEDRIFLSVVTLAELRYGIERMPTGVRRGRLERWLDWELSLRFEGRLLEVDEKICDAWGKLVARSESQGRLLGAMDAILAATAEVHRLTLVTRNAGHFRLFTAVVNPWA